ncbi:OB-fold putative lipoprotein, partial [Escherichia coli]|uniref:OB-fold putative lipoprotein n=17 Tax=Enterobacterales TaxID=91347 RepID=UPI001F192E55
IPVISKLALVLDIYSSLSLIWRYSYCPVFQGATSLYTAEEVYSRFKEHEFRATNDFKKCRLMVTGKIKKIGTVTFSKNPLVTLYISGSNEGLKFIFENTDYNNDKVAKLNVGDTVIIAGWNARPGTFEGIFLDDSQIMTGMISKKKRQMLAVNGGVYDREICLK